VAKSRNDILFRFLGDTKSLDKASNKARGGFKDASKSGGMFQGALGGITKAAGAVGLAIGGMEVVRWAGDAVQMAVAADEIDSKFQAVFGSAHNFTEALSAWADMAGITDTASRDLAATFGNLAQSVGITAADTEDLTLDVATLAGDMASFNDADPAAVFDTLNTAILTAERDGLKKFGISVSQAEVKTEAMSIAVADGRVEVTKADEAWASYSLIVERAGKANGDLERTQDSLANQQRQVSATIKEFQEELGKELMPVYADFLLSLKKSLPALKLVTKGVKETLGPLSMMGEIVSALSDPMAALGDATTITAEDMKNYADTAMLIVNPASWALGKGFEKITEAVYGTVPALVDGELYMDEYRKGIEATTQAQRDARGPSLDYKGFVRQIEDAQAEAYEANFNYADGIDAVAAKAAFAAGKLQELADKIGAAKAAMALALPMYSEFATGLAAVQAGGSLAGAAVTNPVAAAQNQNDLQDLGGQTGG